MNSVLGYQLSEYDCGTTSCLNVLRFFFERKEIEPKWIKKIVQLTMDLGHDGTSRRAMQKVASFFRKIGLHVFYATKGNVTVEKIVDCLENKGIVLLRTQFFVDHYVLIMGCDTKYYYLWDPYFLNKEDYQRDEVQIFSTSFANRKISRTWLEQNKNEDYTLQHETRREAILIFAR